VIGAITAGLYGTGVPPVTNSYESIATFTLGTTASSVTFSSIPSTFKHLQLRILMRDNRAVTENSTQITFNGDTASNYSYHYLAGSGSAASAGAAANLGFIYTFQTSANAAANIFNAGVLDILDYSNVNKYKTTRELQGNDRNGAGSLNFISGSWRSTSAINSITLTPASGASYVQNSSFALYGIKG
jgi:hypothetical protein